jgi:membrane protease YdiL (CAAX protease family)
MLMGPALLITVIAILVNAKIGHADWRTAPARVAVAAAFSATLALVAVLLLLKQGRIRERLTPKWGDLSMGVLGALTLIICTWAGRTILSPRGVPRQAWLAQVYWFMGDPGELQEHFWVPWLVVLAPMLDEVVWRGWIQDELSNSLGGIRGWLMTALLYALQAAPTLFTLRDPVAGPNPLLFMIALVAGLLFGFLTHVTRRAAPAMIAHAAFSYFILLQYRPML